MNQLSSVIALVLTALAVLVNGGNGNKVHYSVQLYLTVLMLVCSLVAFGYL